MEQSEAPIDEGTAGKERGPVRFPPPLIYIGGLIGAIVLERFWSTPKLPLPLAIAAGLLSALASGLLDARATKAFKKKGTPFIPWHPVKALVTDGPYRYTRNPMYVGMAIFFLGLTLAFGWLWGLALLPVVVLIVDRAVIAREEAYLERKFGAPYTTYKQQVRRWF